MEGWDDRFDRRIYDIFEHASLARVFAPLVSKKGIFGVIEAGCNRRSQQRVLSEANIAAIKAIGIKHGDQH